MPGEADGVRPSVSGILVVSVGEVEGVESMTVLDDRALNRATLARQLLLARAELSVPEAVARLCGLQAQEPQEPFVGLWSRVRAFEPAMLDDALLGRRVVRTHLMRRTVHLVTAEDAVAWRARHEAMLRQRVLGVYRRELAGVDLDELAAAGREVLADGESRSTREIVEVLADRWPGVGVRALGEMVVAVVPVVQRPPRGLWRVRAGCVTCCCRRGWVVRWSRRWRTVRTRSGSRWCGGIWPLSVPRRRPICGRGVGLRGCPPRWPRCGRSW